MLLLFLFSDIAHAVNQTEESVIVDPVGKSENYSAILYDNTNGLLSSSANDISQTSEGFLWIGGYSGLTRYDGNSFEIVQSADTPLCVECLLADSKDRLWIGTNDSGVILMENGEFTHSFDMNDGLGADKINDIEEDESGNIYVGTTSGIAVISPDMTLQPITDPKIKSVYARMIRPGKDGKVYCLSNENALFTLENGTLTYYLDDGDVNYNNITFIAPDYQNPGTIYFGTDESILYRGVLGDGLKETEAIDIAPLNNVQDIKQIGERLWICALNGIGILDSDGFHDLTGLPMNNNVTEMITDYEGNYWFTSSRQGVMKLVYNPFTDIFAQTHFNKTVVNTTCLSEGKLFIGTDKGLKVTDEKDVVSAVPLTSAKTASGDLIDCNDLIELLYGCRIRSIIKDSKDRMWIATWRSIGLVRYDHGEVTVFSEADGLLSNRIRVTYETADGRILVTNTGGISVIEGDKVTASYTQSDGITNSESLAVCEAPNGDILLGTDGGGINIISDKGVRCITKDDGLKSPVIMRIKYDPAKDIFWIITGNSIAYMTTDYQVTTVSNFPYNDNLDLFENSKGEMWVLGSHGICITTADDILDGGEILVTHYGIENGLPCTSTSNSHSELTENGDLYICGVAGVTKINIESGITIVNDLKMAIPYIEADGKKVYPNKNGNFRIPSNVRKVTVYGFVFNYSMTDPLISYQLVGFDPEKMTVPRSALDPVTYTNLSGGSYRFEMMLLNEKGAVSKEISAKIVKEKALHEQTWFYLFTGSLAAALLYLLHIKNLERKMRVLEEKHKEEAERDRVYNELQMANNIQTGILPHDFPAFPDRKEFDLYASMYPARTVGGDFYDYFLIDDDHLCLLIADVSDKGIPAALFMMVSKAILKTTASGERSPSVILSKVNELIFADNPTEMFVTVWLGILELSSGKMLTANGGHEYPAFRQNGGNYELIKDKHGLAIGAMEGINYTDYELQMHHGDQIFVYTDGVTEATDASEEMFGTGRMLEALNQDPEADPEKTINNVKESIDAFVKEAEQFDDLTMLCLRYNGKTGSSAIEADS